MATYEAQYISVTNSCQFETRFCIRYQVGSDWEQTDYTGYFRSGTQTLDGSDAKDLEEGAEMGPRVDPKSGKAKTASTKVIYKKNGVTANYNVTGNLINWSIDPTFHP
jgi:hypothetical protein